MCAYIQQCLFAESRSGGVGGAIVNRELGTMYINASVFEANSAMFGGAIFNYNGV